MAKSEIFAGVCGFKTVVTAHQEDERVQLTIESDCPAIRSLAMDLTEVEPFSEISTRRGLPKTLQLGLKACTHAACPVPVGIIKTVEVEAGLALPADVTIHISKE